MPSPTTPPTGDSELERIIFAYGRWIASSGGSPQLTFQEAKTALLKWRDQEVQKQVMAELEAALTEYNRLQEYMTEPSQDLKFGNGYLLNRITALRTAAALLVRRGQMIFVSCMMHPNMENWRNSIKRRTPMNLCDLSINKQRRHIRLMLAGIKHECEASNEQ
jgi:hypothetical protein